MKQVKKQLNKILRVIEKESLEKGVDITTLSFQEKLLSVENDILGKRGITREEWESKGYSKPNERLVGQLSQTLRKIEKESLGLGIDITSPIFLEKVEEARKRIIGMRGVDVEDFDAKAKDKRIKARRTGEKIIAINETIANNKKELDTAIKEGLQEGKERLYTERYKRELGEELRESDINFLGESINKLYKGK